MLRSLKEYQNDLTAFKYTFHTVMTGILCLVFSTNAGFVFVFCCFCLSRALHRGVGFRHLA